MSTPSPLGAIWVISTIQELASWIILDRASSFSALNATPSQEKEEERKKKKKQQQLHHRA
jgi:hypothetical protein